MKDLNNLKQEFDSMSSKQQWDWLVKTNLKDEFTLYLDNDQTFAQF